MILRSAWRPGVETRADVTWSPIDDRWYQNLTSLANSGGSGIPISPETIFNCGTVLAAVRFLANSWAMLPPVVIRDLGGGRREPVPGHYAQRVLRNPNLWQTGYRWREINMVRAATWGDSFNRIVGGREAFAEELRPLDPARVRVTSQRADGGLVYEHTPPGGPKETLGQEQVLHFRGLSLDGISGAKTYQLIRNAVGIALLAERHVTTFLRKGARIGGFLVPAGAMDEPARKELKESVNEAFGGPNNTGSLGLLPFGIDFKPASFDNQKGQLLELQNWTVEDILRRLGVPGVVVGYSGNLMGYASADAFFEKGGIRHCMQPWLTNFEQEEQKALLFEDDLGIKHNLDVLMRSNTKDRYAALVQATGRPFMTGNEARAIEDLNPVSDDESMDEVALPSNMTGGGDAPPSPAPAPPGPRPAPGPRPPARRQPQDDDEDPEARVMERGLWALRELAGRIVRAEIAAIKGTKGSRGAAARYAADPEAWRRWAESFYASHAALVRARLNLSEASAREYCDRQQQRLVAGGVSAAEAWEETVPDELVDLAIGA